MPLPISIMDSRVWEEGKGGRSGVGQGNSSNSRVLCSHYIVLGSSNNTLHFVGLEQVFKSDQHAYFSGRVNGDQYSMRFVRE